MQPSFKNYCKDVIKNAKVMSNELEKLDYKIISNGIGLIQGFIASNKL